MSKQTILLDELRAMDRTLVMGIRGRAKRLRMLEVDYQNEKARGEEIYGALRKTNWDKDVAKAVWGVKEEHKRKLKELRADRRALGKQQHLCKKVRRAFQSLIARLETEANQEEAELAVLEASKELGW